MPGCLRHPKWRARPTVMRAPTNQSHRQKVRRYFFGRFICRFSFGTIATHHALTLFVEQRVCLTMIRFRRGGRAGSCKKHNGGIHAQDRFGPRCGRIRARGSAIKPGCANGWTIGSKKHAELS